MSNMRTLVFYATPEHPCSYLNDRLATTMFVDPKADVDQSLYTRLSQLGFRRSGHHYYKPRCNGCNACIPVRIPVARFEPSRSQQRTWTKNKDLQVIKCEPRFRQDHFALYQRYINERHRDGDMFPPTLDQYESFLLESREDTQFVEFRHQSRLLGVAVTDTTQDGLSSIYTFFDPSESRRALGVFGILWQIEEAKCRQLPYLYLGYWIRNCNKMSYKTNYRPIEVLVRDNWVSI
ncbi:arginyltransferase [Hahella sp. CCB-MM4]|uniref:arginyltransferase n=1 Tax=Hahella sp. (strain CCB-MM4) TaxID=1926491 RepID=UPI000B9BCC8B|nr:arginyltransferase [Hahella sp. CCB-MM4]OZG73694.1 arginyltransferase [Hahella sp. CCB-MM4]